MFFSLIESSLRLARASLPLSPASFAAAAAPSCAFAFASLPVASFSKLFTCACTFEMYQFSRSLWRARSRLSVTCCTWLLRLPSAASCSCLGVAVSLFLSGLAICYKCL
eukprot:SAG11_NODE_2236_length_3652_cov_9.578666_4_plen_109_part_00